MIFSILVKATLSFFSFVFSSLFIDGSFLNLLSQRDCIDPAVQGTINVMKSCSKAPTIKRIVFTSSAAAVRFTQLEDIPEQNFTEECWTNEEMCVRDKPHGWVG